MNIDVANSNILLNNNDIFTSPIITFTNVNRNNVIATSTHTLSGSDNNNLSVFKLPEPYITQKMFSENEFQKTQLN
ncbi:hypothetical protein BCR32DRAFT_329167, partial [Anaeromyces robustus]